MHTFLLYPSSKFGLIWMCIADPAVVHICNSAQLEVIWPKAELDIYENTPKCSVLIKSLQNSGLYGVKFKLQNQPIKLMSLRGKIQIVNTKPTNIGGN